MTRNQLIEKRKRKKQILMLKRAGIGGAGAILLLVLVFALLPALRGSGTSKPPKIAEAAKADTDTASKVALDAGRAGKSGWNLDDNGWWYLNDDKTVFSSGWKTIDGQRYYFQPDGYIATGWVNTGAATDSYFDDSGIYDPTQKQKLVALTFDDGPSKNTDTILDVLKKYNAKATFFVVGQQAEYYTDQLKREVSEGMEIGNHTYEHMTLKFHTQEEIKNTLDRNDETINKLTGVVPAVMRPTGGGVDENVARAVTKPMIQWNIDTLDWKTRDANNTVATATSKVTDGSIILMHDLYEATADAVKELVPQLHAMGYKMVTVSELAEAYGYPLERGGLYFDFKPDGAKANKSPAELLEAIQNGYSA